MRPGEGADELTIVTIAVPDGVGLKGQVIGVHEVYHTAAADIA